jgi:aminopeptidase N
VRLSDASGSTEVTLFSEVLSRSRELLVEGTAVLMSVEAKAENESLRLTANDVEGLEKAAQNVGQGIRLWLEETASVEHIRDVLQASQAFDAITYQKGGAVIRMLEDFVGADVFRQGVRNYMAAHAYGNAVTDDLWRELDKVSTTPVSDVAHDFTLQDGVPLVTVEPSDKGVRLTQSRFAMDGSREASHDWRVPVIAAPPSGGTPWRGLVAGQVHLSATTGYHKVSFDEVAVPDLALLMLHGVLDEVGVGSIVIIR